MGKWGRTHSKPGCYYADDLCNNQTSSVLLFKP